MAHEGEAARPTTVGSTELDMPGAVRGSEVNIGSGTFDGSFRTVAERGEVPVELLPHLHQEPGPGVAYAYPNIGASWRQMALVDMVLVGPQLPDGVVRVHDNDGYYSVLRPRPGAGHGEVLVDLLPDGAGHGEVFVGLLPAGGVAAFVDNVYYALQPRPGAVGGNVLVDMIPDGAVHGEVFVGLLPSGGVAVHGDYGYNAWQPRQAAGRGEMLADPLPGGGVAVQGDYGYNPWQPGQGAGRGEVLADLLHGGGGGMVYNWDYALQPRPDALSGEVLRGVNLGEGYDNRGVVAEHLRRFLPYAGIGACSVAVNGLAAGPGSPAAAFHFFVLLLGSLFLVILHVLRV